MVAYKSAVEDERRQSGPKPRQNEQFRFVHRAPAPAVEDTSDPQQRTDIKRQTRWPRKAFANEGGIEVAMYLRRIRRPGDEQRFQQFPQGSKGSEKPAASEVTRAKRRPGNWLLWEKVAASKAIPKRPMVILKRQATPKKAAAAPQSQFLSSPSARSKNHDASAIGRTSRPSDCA